MNTSYTLSWTNIKGALVSAGIVAIMTALGGILANHSIYGVNWKNLLDYSVMSAIGYIITTLGTNNNTGKFLGFFPKIK